MEFKVTIDAPELSGAIEQLAKAINAGGVILPATVQEKEEKVEKLAPVEEKASETEKKEPVKTESKKEEPEKEEKKTTGITLEAVRGKLADFSSAGKENQVKVMEALQRLGVRKLTEVDAEDYGKLLDLLGLSA